MLHYYGKIIMDIGFAVLVVGFFFFFFLLEFVELKSSKVNILFLLQQL